MPPLPPVPQDPPRPVLPWVATHADLVPAGLRVLDVACGAGANVAYFLGRGHPVTAVDIDVSRLGPLRDDPRVEVIAADLEGGSPPPFAGRTFGGVVVTRYLYRPLLPHLVRAVAPGGALLYETFALGHERFGRPANPAFLLAPGELLAAVEGELRVVAYEEVTVTLDGETGPRPAAVQHIAAVRA